MKVSQVEVDVDLSQEETQPRSRRRKFRLSFTSTMQKPTTIEDIEDNRVSFQISDFYEERGHGVEKFAKTTSVYIKYRKMTGSFSMVSFETTLEVLVSKLLRRMQLVKDSYRNYG